MNKIGDNHTLIWRTLLNLMLETMLTMTLNSTRMRKRRRFLLVN